MIVYFKRSVRIGKGLISCFPKRQLTEFIKRMHCFMSWKLPGKVGFDPGFLFQSLCFVSLMVTLV